MNIKDLNINELKNKESLLYSWPAIIIALIVFWPVGIFLIYKRAKTDKKASFTIGKGVKYGSYFCFFAVIIGIIASFTNEFKSSDIVYFLFYLVAGIALLYFSKKLTKDAEKYKKYISIIVNGNEYFIANIAGAMAISQDDVKKDLLKMIDNGYFKGAYIDEGKGEIIIPQLERNQENSDGNMNREERASKVVSCQCCGAQNTVVGDVGECEYCGSPL